MIDIVMATFNGEKYIAEQLDSILNQTYKDICIIIRDDGSTDNTVNIVALYQKKYPTKIRVIEDNVKCGSSKSNFMQALQYTTSDYIMFSDQDDVWLPEKIQHTFYKMKEIENKVGKNKPILVFGSYKSVDEKLCDINKNNNTRQEAAYKLSFSNLLVQNYVNGCLMMVNRFLADCMGRYDDAILMHDWWAALIAAGGGVIEHIPEIMMLYRQHGNNVVGSVNIKSMSYRLRKIKNPETKKMPKQYLRQAKLLYERCQLCIEYQHLVELRKFINLYKKNKLYRMIELIKGNYLKSDIVRIIGQLFYI